MRLKLALTVLAFTAVAVPASVAHAGEPVRTVRTVCLNGQKTIEVTPDNENTIGEPYTNGPCPTTTTSSTKAPDTTKAPVTTTTTKDEIVTLCIQGHTVTGRKGSTNPTGIPYHEGPCDEVPPVVRATPHFTG